MALSYNRFCYYEQHLCMKKLRPDNNKEAQYVLFKTKPIKNKIQKLYFRTISNTCNHNFCLSIIP